MIEFTDHMKLNKKEDQVWMLLQRGDKILMGANMKTKCGAESDGKTTQRLPHMGMHPIYSYQIQTLL